VLGSKIKEFIVITKSDGKYFKDYSPKSKDKFYASKYKTFDEANNQVKYFKNKGVYAKTYYK